MATSLVHEPHVVLDAPLPGMVGTHPLMREVYRLVRRVAPTELPVVVVGETGVGKELVARALHALSPRRQGPFVAVNAAALPETLLESELFGHARGAFSGAGAEKPGLLELAHRGTFFCDELAALAPAQQAKLLRVVEEGTVRRLGGLAARPAAPRWVVTCQEYDAGHNRAKGVREDLWYRLSGAVVRVPPLRDRPSDVPALVAHVLAAADVDPGRVHPQALEVLMAAPWPGNVRELKQVLGRLVLSVDGAAITTAAVQGELQHPADPAWSRERADLVVVLEASGWDMRRAARALGVSRSTLYRRLRTAGVRRPARVSHVFLERLRDTRDSFGPVSGAHPR
jgi:DNA-binding NtrC family response regulator